MTRLPRVVVPGLPHHVTQRGNRRQRIFFHDEDYVVYRRLLATYCRSSRTRVLAYCLMPNHVHLILVPADEYGLRDALAEAHRRYTRMVNFREGWRGHLWQERFHSCVMDGRHLVAAARYVELNPVRARLCANPGGWTWSSAPAHLARQDDELVSVAPLLDIIPNWAEFLGEPDADGIGGHIHAHASTGRPLGPRPSWKNWSDASVVHCDAESLARNPRNTRELL
jgi:putative transposase